MLRKLPLITLLAARSREGLIHVTYTWQRERVRHVALDPARLKPVPIVDGRWPQRIDR